MLEAELSQQSSQSSALLNGSPFSPSTKDFIDSFGERSPALSSLRSEALSLLSNSYSVLSEKRLIQGSTNLVTSVKNNSNSVFTANLLNRIFWNTIRLINKDPSLLKDISKLTIRSNPKITIQSQLPELWWQCKASESWKGAITDLFSQYLNSTRDKAIVLFNEDQDQWISIPYTTRFEKRYLRKVSKRLSDISLSNGYFVSIDPDPKKAHNVVECVKELNEAWNNIRTALIKHEVDKAWSRYKAALLKKNQHISRKKLAELKHTFYEKHGNKIRKKIKYLRVLEFGTGKRKGVSFEEASHLPHLHIVLSGISWIDYKWAHTLYPDRIDFEIIRGSVDLNSYVLKYVKKKLCVDYSEQLLYPALYWLTNARIYSVSRGLLPSPSPHSSSGIWLYLGVYTLSSTDRIGEYIASFKKSPPSFNLHVFGNHQDPHFLSIHSLPANQINIDILRAWANNDNRFLGIY